MPEICRFYGDHPLRHRIWSKSGWKPTTKNSWKCGTLKSFRNWNLSNNYEMIPRIKSILPLDNFTLLVEFDGGKKVVYDVKDDIRTLEDFRVLETEYGLFSNARLDSSRTCVYWTDRVDLPSDTILEYGQPA